MHFLSCCRHRRSGSYHRAHAIKAWLMKKHAWATVSFTLLNRSFDDYAKWKEKKKRVVHLPPLLDATGHRRTTSSFALRLRFVLYVQNVGNQRVCAVVLFFAQHFDQPKNTRIWGSGALRRIAAAHLPMVINASTRSERICASRFFNSRALTPTGTVCCTVGKNLFIINSLLQKR